MNEVEIKKALRYLLNEGGHSVAFVKGIEQLFRNETRHFQSSAFLQTFGAGMEATVPEFPYGWHRLEKFWLDNRNYQPIGVFKMVENTSELQVSRGSRVFVKFPDLTSSMMTVAKNVELLGSFGAWFNNLEKDRTAYEQTLNSIIPRYTNEILTEKK